MLTVSDSPEARATGNGRKLAVAGREPTKAIA